MHSVTFLTTDSLPRTRSLPSLVLIAQAIFLLQRGHTDRNTDIITSASVQVNLRGGGGQNGCTTIITAVNATVITLQELLWFSDLLSLSFRQRPTYSWLEPANDTWPCEPTQVWQPQMASWSVKCFFLTAVVSTRTERHTDNTMCDIGSDVLHLCITCRWCGLAGIMCNECPAPSKPMTTYWIRSSMVVAPAVVAAAELQGRSSGSVCDVLADLTWPFWRAVIAPLARLVAGRSGDASESVRLLYTHQLGTSHSTQDA